MKVGWVDQRKENARVEEIDFLAASTVPAFLCDGEIQELSGDFLFCGEDDAILC